MAIFSDAILCGIKEASKLKKQEWNPNIDMYKFSASMFAMTEFATMLVLPNKKYLNLESIPKMIRIRLFNQLPEYKNLTKLILQSGSGGLVTDVLTDKFKLGLRRMKNLVHFSLKYDCTDSIIQVLSENCWQTLQLLDVEHSRMVGDGSTDWIKKFYNLFTINVFYTRLSLDAKVKFLNLKVNWTVMKIY